MLFGIYLTLNGIERFCIEKIRVNATYDIWGIAVTQAEIIAVLMFVVGVGLIGYAQSQRRTQIGSTSAPESRFDAAVDTDEH